MQLFTDYENSLTENDPYYASQSLK